jgi:hypothetical protein
MRDKSLVGHSYFAGTITRTDGHIGRHIAVLFKCAHCEYGIGRTRFSHLKAPDYKKYQTKSCGCLKRKRFDDYHRAKADDMHPTLVRSIFDSYCVKFAEETAETFGISVYVANYAWQRWCRTLEALSAAHRHEVYAVCQVSWKAAQSKFGQHNASELRWICRHWRRGLSIRNGETRLSTELRAEQRANALSLFALYAPAGSITGSVYEDACVYMESALAVARGPGSKFGRYIGELTSRELARVQRSDFAWVFEMLRSMHRYQVLECFGQLGVEFLDICLLTFARRRQRRNDRLAAIQADAPPMKNTSGGGSTGARYVYLPRPDAHPSEIATLVVDHYPALRAA